MEPQIRAVIVKRLWRKSALRQGAFKKGLRVRGTDPSCCYRFALMGMKPIRWGISSRLAFPKFHPDLMGHELVGFLDDPLLFEFGVQFGEYLW